MLFRSDKVKQYRQSKNEAHLTEIQLAFYGGSFTGLSPALQIEYLALAKELKLAGQIDKIRMSTRPDYIDSVVIERLKEFTVDIVELGVQSLDEDILLQSKRGHNVDDVVTAVTLLQQANISLGIQLMVGLPSDTPDKSIATVLKTIQLKPNFVRIYPTVVIKETELAQLWQQGKYKQWSLEETIETVAQMAKLFAKANIPLFFDFSQ